MKLKPHLTLPFDTAIRVRVVSPAGALLFYGQWAADSTVDIIAPSDQLLICDSIGEMPTVNASNATDGERGEQSTTGSA